MYQLSVRLIPSYEADIQLDIYDITYLLAELKRPKLVRLTTC